MESDWVFANNSKYLITIYLQPNGVKLYHLKLFFLFNIIPSLKFLWSMPMGCSKDIGIKKSEFVVKTQFV